MTYGHLERERIYRLSVDPEPVEETIFDHLPPSVSVSFETAERRKCNDCKTVKRMPEWSPPYGFCTECEGMRTWRSLNPTGTDGGATRGAPAESP